LALDAKEIEALGISLAPAKKAEKARSGKREEGVAALDIKIPS